MTSDSWPLRFVIAFHALLFHAMPRFSRPGILFAVTVPDAFVSDAGRTLVSRYRAIVWSGAALALAVVLLFPAPALGSGGQGFLYAAGVAGNMIVGISAWLWAYRRARAHAIPHSEIRVASLVPRDTSLPGGSLFASGPFLILLITAVLEATHRDQVPEGSRITRTLGPLAFGALYVVMMVTMAVSLSRRTRQIAVEGMAVALEQRFRRLNVFVLVLAAYGVAMMLSAVTLESIPAFGVTLRARFAFLLLPLVLFNFGVAFWMFRVGQGGQRAVAATARQDTWGTPRRTMPGKLEACSITTRATRQSGSRSVSVSATRSTSAIRARGC
jgi:cbb3-type cytochrome oxidase subunit 3